MNAPETDCGPAAAFVNDRYLNFAALAANEIEGVDYSITVEPVAHSSVAVIAPHGGSIERRTSHIARAIAAHDFNCYLFEGLDPNGSFDELHITSHRFDEPRCLALIEPCPIVIAIHGCAGKDQSVMLGGRDRKLITALESAIAEVDAAALKLRHKFPGKHRDNICNRGGSHAGVQIEFSDGLRGSPREAAVIEAIRKQLLAATVCSS